MCIIIKTLDTYTGIKTKRRQGFIHNFGPVCSVCASVCVRVIYYLETRYVIIKRAALDNLDAGRFHNNQEWTEIALATKTYIKVIISTIYNYVLCLNIVFPV